MVYNIYGLWGRWLGGGGEVVEWRDDCKWDFGPWFKSRKSQFFFWRTTDRKWLTNNIKLQSTSACYHTENGGDKIIWLNPASARAPPTKASSTGAITPWQRIFCTPLWTIFPNTDAVSSIVLPFFSLIIHIYWQITCHGHIDIVYWYLVATSHFTASTQGPNFAPTYYPAENQ